MNDAINQTFFILLCLDFTFVVSNSGDSRMITITPRKIIMNLWGGMRLRVMRIRSILLVISSSSFITSILSKTLGEERSGAYLLFPSENVRKF